MTRIRAWVRRIIAEFREGYREARTRGEARTERRRDRLEQRLVAQRSRIAILTWLNQGRSRVRVVVRDE